LAASQKIRTGLVELRTSTGSVYAKPSFWERVYLLWMFRNFHCLPKEVLGLHQRRLIDKLCQAAVRQRSIAQTDIIGIVENVQLLPMPRAEVAVATSNLVEMSKASAEIEMPRAVAAGGMPMRWDVPAERSDVARLIATSAKVEEISAPKQHPAPQDEIEDADSAPPAATRSGAGMRRPAWILAGVFVAVGAGFLYHFQTQARPVPLARISQPAIEAPPLAPANAPSTAVALPELSLPPVAAEPKPPATVPESKVSQAAIASLPQETRHSSPPIARPPTASPEVVNDHSTPEPRLQVTQPPESGFRYPVAPSSALSGRVSLHAVIGLDGAVRRVDVLSGNRALAGAAVRAVRHWRYPAPAMNGHAVEAETNIAINFIGDDAVSVSFPAAR
jgi:hypothetical protein